nr:MAG TPA: hypothetical protein [Caudoviricetes sp.]
MVAIDWSSYQLTSLFSIPSDFATISFRRYIIKH